MWFDSLSSFYIYFYNWIIHGPNPAPFDMAIFLSSNPLRPRCWGALSRTQDGHEDMPWSWELRHCCGEVSFLDCLFLWFLGIGKKVLANWWGKFLKKLIRSSVIFPWPPVVLTCLAKSSVAGASLLGVSSTAMPAGKTTTCQQSLVPRDNVDKPIPRLLSNPAASILRWWKQGFLQTSFNKATSKTRRWWLEKGRTLQPNDLL